MKKILSVSAFLLLIPFHTQAQTTWKAKSYAVKFKIKNIGLWVNGSLKGLDADIRFDADALASSTIEASVDAKTIDTGNEKRDNHLRSDDYFDTEKYPKIMMKSVSFTVSKDKKDSYVGQFDLTIKGTTKRVAVPFTFTKSGNTAVFKGSFTINRLDFKVGSSSWILSDNAVLNVLVNTEK